MGADLLQQHCEIKAALLIARTKLSYKLKGKE
jgi:hypothetical protein